MAPRSRRALLWLVLGLALLLAFAAVARAQEDDDAALEDDDADISPPPEPVDPEPSTPPAPKKERKIVPFKPSSIVAPFLEQFDSNWASRWIVSEAKKVVDGITDEDLLRYRGQWAVEEPTVYKGFEGDVGLVAKTAAAHHAIAVKLPAPIDPTGKPLVAQYEVKLQDGLECGGAYIKLLKDTPEFDAKKFEDKFPYVIMFGPDKCGTTNKVHFIFKHKNPKTGVYEEKHLKNPPAARSDKTSTLYTLIVNPDNTFEILINNESATKGSLLEDFTPAVNPPKEIDDPEDKKPADWVDEAEIPDPEAKKPDDWDEDAPEYIPDEDAKKPDDWLDNEPEQIPDPDAVKPEDWDEEEDGEWVPPTIANPKCETGNCGEWKRPNKKNPAYKGKWKAPKIPNPAYKGVWAPRKIANPDFFEDLHPANFEPIGAVGIEIWTMQKDILFDNFYLGHSIEDAKKFADETWKAKVDLEKVEADADVPVETKEKKTDFSSSDDEGFVANLRREFSTFYTAAKADPIKAVKKYPLHTLALAIVSVLLLSTVGSLFGGSAPAPAPKIAKTIAKEEKETPAEEVAAKAEESPAAKKRSAKAKADE